MKHIVLSTLLVVFFTGCDAQNTEQMNSKSTTDTSQNKPEISWKVNKKFDDDGKLISYDSTAVWSYTSGKATHRINADSVMMAFRKHFDSGFPSMFQRSFGEPVWNDSLFFRDFTTPDYFTQKWQQHYFDMEQMMRQMDSFRNSFLNDNYPGLTHKDKE